VPSSEAAGNLPENGVGAMALLGAPFCAQPSEARGKLPLEKAAPSLPMRGRSGSTWAVARTATSAASTSKKRRIDFFKHEQRARANRTNPVMALDGVRFYESPLFGPGTIGGEEYRGMESGAGSGSTSPKTSP